MITHLHVTAENASRHAAELKQAGELYNAKKRTAWGKAAFQSDPLRLARTIAKPLPRFRTEAILLQEAERTLAAAQLWITDRDLTTTLTADLSLPTELLPHGTQFDEGLGELLLKLCQERAKTLGFTRLEVWTDHPNSSLTAPTHPPEPSSPLSSAPAQAGTPSIPFPETDWGITKQDPWAALLTEAGFQPGLLTRFSSLHFRNNPITNAFLAEQGCPPLDAHLTRSDTQDPLGELVGDIVVPAGYELLVYDGLIPEQAVTGLAALLSDFNEDNPTAQMNSARDEHTPERVAEDNRRAVENGVTFMSTLLLHTESGAAAGYSRIEYLPQSPKRLQQDLTMTARNHRGHGFGALTKAVNLAAAAQTWPATEVIATENSDHNVHMLRINIRMGFQQDGAIAGWICPL